MSLVKDISLSISSRIISSLRVKIDKHVNPKKDGYSELQKKSPSQSFPSF